MKITLSKAVPTKKIPSVYVFYNLLEKQAIVTRSPVIKEHNTFQIGTISPKIRKDHWKPILVISGFDSEKTADIVFHSVATYPKEIRDASFQTLKKSLKVQALKNQINHKLSATCRVLEDLPNYINDTQVFPTPITKEALKLTCHWETDYWRDLVKNDNLNWPSYITHDKLKLIRGRSIANEQFKTVQSGFDRLNEINKALKERKETKATTDA